MMNYCYQIFKLKQCQFNCFKNSNKTLFLETFPIANHVFSNFNFEMFIILWLIFFFTERDCEHLKQMSFSTCNFIDKFTKAPPDIYDICSNVFPFYRKQSVTFLISVNKTFVCIATTTTEFDSDSKFSQKDVNSSENKIESEIFICLLLNIYKLHT